MNFYGNYKSPLGYQTGENQIDTYGVDHSGFSTRDELEYQFARQNKENQIIENYNNQGITKNYPQYGTNFWGGSDNNYGFGSSNIHDNIENRENQTEQSYGLENSNQNQNLSWPQSYGLGSKNQTFGQENNNSTQWGLNNTPLTQKNNNMLSGNLFGNNNLFNQNQSVWNKKQYQTPTPSRYNLKDLTDRLQQYQNNALDKQPMYDLNQLPDINALGHYTNSNQTVIPDNKQMSMISTRPTLSQWLKKANTLPMTMNGTNMSGEERIKALVNGQPIVINVEDNPQANNQWPLSHSHTLGETIVNKYSPLIDKYAKQYDLDANIAKAILYNEISDYHRFGLDYLGDLTNKSTSTLPMNIQGKTWGNFHGQIYDIKNPEQNIELGVSILKAIYDAVPDKDIAKIATLWNNTVAKKINEYGKRTKDYYINQYWDTSQMTPVLEQ